MLPRPDLPDTPCSRGAIAVQAGAGRRVFVVGAIACGDLKSAASRADNEVRSAPNRLHMASLDSLNGIKSSSAPAEVTDRPPANASAELAKYESQLSDWVHCPSSKTSAGKAKIAEISDRIETLKAQMKHTEDAKTSVPQPQSADGSANAAGPRLRFDQQGTWLNVQA